MKSLQIKGYGCIKDNLMISEIETPKITADQVLIEVYSAAVNPIDYKTIEGALKRIQKLTFPTKIGLDISGIVVDKGSNVKSLNIGDEVFSMLPLKLRGSFSEFVAVESSFVCIKPSNLSFNESASLPLVGLTSIQSFAKAKISNGDNVLIHAGSGGIGTFAIQYAKSKGAYVYTTTSTENVAWVKELGADRVIDYKKENYLDIVSDIDIVFDTLGGAYTVDAFEVIKKAGRVVSIAGDLLDSESAKELKLNGIIRFILAIKRRAISKQIKKKSAFYKFIFVRPNNKQLKEIKKLAQTGAIKPVIDKIFSFSTSIDALIYQKSGRAKGKIVIKIK